MTAVVLTQEEPVCAREGNGAQNCVNGQLVGPDPGSHHAATLRRGFLRQDNPQYFPSQ